MELKLSGRTPLSLANDLVNGDSTVAQGEAESITLAINILKEEV